MRGDDQARREDGGDSGLGLTPEVARFLRAHPPFDALDPGAVARLAAAAELESFATAQTIFAQGEAPVEHLRIVRSGAVEIVADDRVLDLIGEGEMFGHASMLSGLPTGFAARAAEPTVCFRVGHALAEQVLAAPEGLRYVARSLMEEPTDLHVLAREASANVADEPVATLLRGEPAICDPETTVREAARRMGAAAANAIVVISDPAHPGSGPLGIVTDRDLRTAIADGRTGDARVAEIMSTPAFTCGAQRPAGEVLLEMLDRGLRHLPVLSPEGALLGVIEDMDLVAARTRSSFYLRRRIAAADDERELAAVARELAPMVASLHDAQIAAANVMAVYAVCVDALTRRLLELAATPVSAEFAWLAMGSQARREALPSSDVDSAIVWFGEPEDDAPRERLVALGGEVLGGLQRCGLRLDEHGVNASDRRFVRSIQSWQRAARGWLEDPTRDKALVLSAVVLDSRPVWGVHTGTPVADTFALAPDHPALVRLAGRFAISQRPPTGFLRGLVVEHAGEHRGRLDLKRGGVLPIVALARWAAMAAGVTIASTPERLRAAAAAQTLSSADAHSLADAFALINDLRLTHQVAQIRAGVAPDDHLAPDELSALMRSQLREAFRAVTDIQKRVASSLH